MNFDLSDDQKMLRDQSRRYLDDRIDYDALRGLITREAGGDPSLWAEVADLGWQAVAVPEIYGGLGLGVLEQCVLVEELGRAVAPIPFVSSAIAAFLIMETGQEEQKRRLLPALASGEAIASFAFFEGVGTPDRETTLAFTVTESNSSLNGRKWPVIDAGMASLLIVAAKRNDGSAGLFLVETGASGLAFERVTGFDQLRGGWAVVFKDTPCESLDACDANAAMAAAFDLAATLTAFEQVGGAEAALEMARSYSLERRAFGRQIGSFQAIKHKLADMLTKIELARSNAYYAGWAIAHDAPDRALAAATARVSATEAYEFAARENMQVHGGISFTWEANCHFHYRRSRLLAVAYGSPRYWNSRIVDELMVASPSTVGHAS